MRLGRVARFVLAALVVGTGLTMSGVSTAQPVSDPHFVALDEIPFETFRPASRAVPDPSRHELYGRSAAQDLVSFNYRTNVSRVFTKFQSTGTLFDHASGDLYLFAGSRGDAPIGLVVIRRHHVLSSLSRHAVGGVAYAGRSVSHGLVALATHVDRPHRQRTSLLWMKGTTVVGRHTLCQCIAARGKSRIAYDKYSHELYVVVGTDIRVFKAQREVARIPDVPSGRLVVNPGRFLYVVGHGGTTVIKGRHVVGRVSFGSATGSPFRVADTLVDPGRNYLYVSDAGVFNGANGPQVAIVRGATWLKTVVAAGPVLVENTTSGDVYASNLPGFPRTNRDNGASVFNRGAVLLEVAGPVYLQTYDPVTDDVLGVDGSGEVVAVRASTVVDRVPFSASGATNVISIPENHRVIAIGGGSLEIWRTIGDSTA